MASRSAERPSQIRNRAQMVFGCILLCYSAIAGRLFLIQGIQGAATRKEARDKRITRFVLGAVRGRILDRNGAPVALSRTTTDLAFDPGLVEKPGLSAPIRAEREQALAVSMDLLATTVGIDRKMLEEKVQLARAQYIEWIGRTDHRHMDTILQSANCAIIADGISADAAKEFYRKKHKLNGFSLKEGAHRENLLGDSAMQLVGNLDPQGNPTMGLERSCNSWLARHNGHMTAERDAGGRPIIGTEIETVSPVSGMDVHLTIDTTIQKLARQELQAAFDAYHPLDAEAVVVDPATGDVLAMVSLPTYDPRLADQLPKSVRDEIGRYQSERCAGMSFEPGSTLKSLAIAYAIDRNVISPDTPFVCNGQLTVSHRTIHDSHEVPHGVLTADGILRNSCNICTAQIGLKLGIKRLLDAERQFGIGAPLNLHLPLEVRSSLRLPDRVSQYDATAARVAFGQSIVTSPLHVAMAYAALANGGVLMKPRLITSLTRGDQVLQEWKPERVRQAVSQPTADLIMNMLENVVTTGTGKRAALPGHVVAGKTGTAQKFRGGAWRGDFIGSFVGITPSRANSKFRCVIYVSIDEPKGAHFGADVAAPVVQRIGAKLMDIKGVPADDPGWTQFRKATEPQPGTAR